MILGIALVFGLAGWRFFNREAEKVSIARPVAAPAKPPAPVAATESATSQNQADLTQQFLVDDLQLLQDRVVKQEAEIKRLKVDLETLGRKYEALTSFASTAESKPAPAVQPPKKKKKRIVRRSKKR